MMKATNNKPTQRDVRKFVDDNFLSGDELVNVTLNDWSLRPRLVDRVRDPYYQEWIKDLNDIWKILARRMTKTVGENPKRHSLIYVNNTFIVPGGRFKGT